MSPGWSPPNHPASIQARRRTRVEGFAFLGLSLTFLPWVEPQFARAWALTVCPVLTLLLIRGSKCNDSSELGWPLKLAQFLEPVLWDLS